MCRTRDASSKAIGAWPVLRWLLLHGKLPEHMGWQTPCQSDTGIRKTLAHPAASACRWTFPGTLRCGVSEASAARPRRPCTPRSHDLEPFDEALFAPGDPQTWGVHRGGLERTRIERLRVEQAIKLKTRACEVRNAVFRVNLGYLPTHYSGARLALHWRSARLRDSLTPN